MNFKVVTSLLYSGVLYSSSSSPSGSGRRHRGFGRGGLSGEEASGKARGATICAPWGRRNWPLPHGGQAPLRSGWRKIMGRH